MKKNNETEDEDKQKRVENERSKAGIKSFSLVGKGLLVLGLVSPSRTEFSFLHL